MPILRADQTLWTPNQVKRSGAIPQIDWTNPLAFRLVSYWYPLGDAAYIDLVTGDTTKKGTASKNTLPVARSSPFGVGPGFTATTSFCESVNLAPLQSWSAPYSFACGFYQLGAITFGVNPAWFGIADTTGNDPFMIFSPSASNLTWSYGNSGGQPIIAIASNTFNVAVGVATGATTQANYLNGITQTAGAATSAFSGSSLRYVFGDANADSGNPTDNINALVFFGAAWQRALTKDEATLLWQQPYSLLVPQEPEMMIIQLAVTDVLRAQIWM